MDIFRFDEEMSIPISQFGSRLRVTPLTDDTRDGVQVAYLPAGGLIGRHPAVSDQLFAVVSGSGWVSGDDGVQCEIRSGYAARWHAGEEHEASTDSGLTAIIIQ